MLRNIAFALACTSCTVAVDVDEFRFPDGPCGAPRTCESSGETVRYVIVDQDVARYTTEDLMTRRLEGFDLDFSEEPICGHQDDTRADGTPGIDNQLAPLLTVLEVSGQSIRDSFRDSIFSGELLQMYEVSNIDDFENDDCVTVRIGRALVPRGISLDMIPDYLDADGDGVVDDDLVLDINPLGAADEDACIRDGFLHALPGRSTVALPTEDGTVDLDVALSQTSGRISPEGLSQGLQGGGFSVQQLIDLIQPGDPTGALGDVIRNDADLVPIQGECSLISIGLTFEAKSFVAGERI